MPLTDTVPYCKTAGAMATEHTEITEQTSAHQATISKILGLREQLMDNLPGTFFFKVHYCLQYT